ncbi:MAG: DUF6273 domain-containing protein [Eubacterium sp.]|nr:DUF6273 domain-containing protein [Eubacterium sp.]
MVKSKKKRSLTKKALTTLLAISMAAGLISTTAKPMEVRADVRKNVACVGTYGIASPVEPSSKDDPWCGSFVWYGKYDGTPVKYRVLDPDTTKYGSESMFLDCDSMLYFAPFEYEEHMNEWFKESNKWGCSDIKTNLNGKSFLDKEGVFTNTEKKCIARSSYKTGLAWDPSHLVGDQIFLLSKQELCGGYGYGGSLVKEYNSRPREWWLRSTLSSSNWQYDALYVDVYRGVVSYVSYEKDWDYPTDEYGVSPAFNVDLKSIIFSSVVSGTYGDVDTEYKLTLKDTNIQTSITSGKDVSFDDTLVTVPYTVSGTDSGNVNRVSILILDKEYTPGNSNEANILCYGRLTTAGDSLTSGEGTFNIPGNLSMDKWGVDYHVYLVAEDVNDTYETDYASEPLELSKPIYKKVEETKNSGAGTSNADGTNGGDTGNTSTGNTGSNGNTSTGTTTANNGGTTGGANSSGSLADNGSTSSGYTPSNEWINGRWYNADGTCTYDGILSWKCNSTGWWVEDTTGWYPVACWQKIDGIWYYFNAAGYMASNEYVDGYWLNSNGSCSDEYYLTWKHNSKGWWVEDKSGWWPSLQWLKVDGCWYYFNSTGYMVTNKYIDGYWIGSDGVCQ